MDVRMDHIVLNVVDIEEMLDFYREVLKLPAERLEAFRAGKVPFPSVRLNRDTIIDLFPRGMWETVEPEEVCRPNLNHLCLSLGRRDWEALRESLREKAIPVEEGPVERWGAHGTGLSIYFRDPEENRIEVRYYEDSERDRPCLLGS